MSILFALSLLFAGRVLTLFCVERFDDGGFEFRVGAYTGPVLHWNLFKLSVNTIPKTAYIMLGSASWRGRDGGLEGGGHVVRLEVDSRKRLVLMLAPLFPAALARGLWRVFRRRAHQEGEGA